MPFVDFDIEKAKRVLESAGYFRDREGRLCYPEK
jgi:hypothetical protein